MEAGVVMETVAENGEEGMIQAEACPLSRKSKRLLLSQAACVVE